MLIGAIFMAFAVLTLMSAATATNVQGDPAVTKKLQEEQGLFYTLLIIQVIVLGLGLIWAAGRKAKMLDNDWVRYAMITAAVFAFGISVWQVINFDQLPKGADAFSNSDAADFQDEFNSAWYNRLNMLYVIIAGAGAVAWASNEFRGRFELFQQAMKAGRK